MQVWDPEGVIIIPDHYIFTSDPRANRNVDILRCFWLCLSEAGSMDGNIARTSPACRTRCV